METQEKFTLSLKDELHTKSILYNDVGFCSIHKLLTSHNIESCLLSSVSYNIWIVLYFLYLVLYDAWLLHKVKLKNINIGETSPNHSESIKAVHCAPKNAFEYSVNMVYLHYKAQSFLLPKACTLKETILFFLSHHKDSCKESRRFPRQQNKTNPQICPNEPD